MCKKGNQTIYMLSVMTTRKKLAHTDIEYVLNPDGSPGYGWPIFTGCEQPPSVCATRAICWARLGHHRFGETGWSKLYNPDFSLKFNEDLLEAPFSLHKPSTIAVAFTSDKFGPGSESYRLEQGWVKNRVWQLPQHRFLFLTKSPHKLAQFNPWPPNAWLGMTITGAETPERQRDMIAQLCSVEGGKRWISYEPMLGPFEWPAALINFDWLVMGAQSPGAVKPKLEWVEEIVEAAGVAGAAGATPIWLKNNLYQSLAFLKLPKRQERAIWGG